MTTIEPIKTNTTEAITFKSKFAEQKAAKLLEQIKTTTKNCSIKTNVEKQLRAFQAYCNINKIKK